MTNNILQDILLSMADAVQNIQLDAVSKGFTGDINDAPAVMQSLANYSMDHLDYALLYANSATIENGNRLVQKYGDDEEKAKAAKLAPFDYVSN